MRMVEWKKLGEVCTYYRGVTYNKKQEVPLGTGGTKILRANNITLDSNTLNFEDIKEVSSDVKIKEYQWLNPNDILICAGSGSKEHVGKVAFIFEKIGYAYGGFMGKLVVSEGLQSRFLFHVISSHLFKKYLEVALNSTTINNLNAEIVNNFLIPVPSISEQTRIVGILDTFTASIENLKQQIAQRRKQYEHYRDQLLDLEGKEGVEMKTSDFCSLKAGKSVSAKEITDYENGRYACYGGNGIRGYVSYYSHEGDYPIIGRQGALCGCVCWATDKFYATEHAVVVTGKEFTSQRFLFYMLQNANLNQYKTQGAQPGLSVTKLNEVRFFIPSLPEQQRIISILDTFEASIANLEQQLAQRERQYEYYRNKLLTFE